MSTTTPKAMENSAVRWLLLHGTPLTPAIWTGVASQLPGLVWIPDVTPAPGISNAQRQIANSLIDQAREAPGPWRVVGHSFGGQIALELAAAAPDLVEKLIVVCSRDTPFPPFTAAAESIEAGNPVDTDMALHRWFRPGEIAARSTLIDDVAAQLLRANRQSWATALRAIADFEGSTTSAGITAPAVVIAAEHDQVATPAAMRELADRLPVAEYSVLADAAHMSPFLYPVQFAAAINRRHTTCQRPPVIGVQ